MTWDTRYNRNRRRPWPESQAAHYYHICNLATTLAQALSWITNDTLHLEFCEDLQALVHNMIEHNRQLWVAKGGSRWGDYVLESMRAIDTHGPTIISNLEKVIDPPAGDATPWRRYVTRAYNAVSQIRGTLEHVNPPAMTNGMVDKEATAAIEQWLELMQIRRHQNGDD